MIKRIILTVLLFCTFIVYAQQKPIEEISAAPNPFKISTKITFKSNSNTNVIFTVKNVLGKTVYTEKINTVKGKNSVPFFKGNLSKGIYIYTLQNKKQITSKRFVIQ
jgi:hypothetical protein